MKKLLVALLAVGCLACCGFAVACNDAPIKSQVVNFVDFDDNTIYVEYGAAYRIENYVYDSAGNAYSLVASVTDDDGNAVEPQGGLIYVEKPSYTIIYTATTIEKEETKTIVVKGYAKPRIEVDNTELTVNIDADGYYIPDIIAVDGTGTAIENVKKEIYYVDYLADEKTAYDGTSDCYVPEKEGTYYLLITATDKDGFFNTEKVVFYGKSYGATPGITMTEEYASRIVNAVSSKNGLFVQNEDLPEDVRVGYEADAVKIDFKSAHRLMMSMNYSARALSNLDENLFNRVRFNFYFKTENGKTFMINGDQSTAENPCFLYKYYKKAQVLPTNSWLQLEMSLKEFIEYLGGENSTNTDLFLLKTWQQADAEIYIGDLEIYYQAPTLLKASNETKAAIVASTVGEYVESQRLAEVFDSLDDYSGGAIKLTRQGAQVINVTLGMTAEEVAAIKTQYGAVKFRFGVKFLTATTVMANGNFGGIIRTSGVTSGFTNCTWYEKTVTLDEFITAMNENDDKNNTVFFMNPYANGTFELYIGDIEFVSQ